MALYSLIGHRRCSKVRRKTASKYFTASIIALYIRYCVKVLIETILALCIRYCVKVLIETNVNISSELVFF